MRPQPPAALPPRRADAACARARPPCPPTRFVTSTIIGATSLPQLKENIDAFSIELSKVGWVVCGRGALPGEGGERGGSLQAG